MIKDCWIYQDSDAVTPWAIYVIKEYTPNCSFADIVLDVTIYSEDIDDIDNMRAFLNLHYDTVSGYVERLQDEILVFGGRFDMLDFQKVEKALCSFIFG